MEMEALQVALAELDAGHPVVLATVVATRGSTPRRPGTKMLLRSDGGTFGTIGGGCGEDEVRREALEVLHSGRPVLYRVDLTGGPADPGDRVCGGVMEVLVERLDPR